MAEEPQKAAEEVVAAVAETETETHPDKDKPIISEQVVAAVAETETETQPDKDKPIITEQVVEGQGEKEKPQTQTQTPVEVEDKTISQSVSFKEETNVVGDLPEAQKKALDELKHLIQDALNKHELTAPPPPPPPPPKDEDKKAPEEVTQEDKNKEQVAQKVTQQEKKEEEKPGSASEDPKIEEKAEAEPKVEALTETVTPTTAEEKKAEAVEVVSVTQVSVVDEDGTKTVEAIEETIVSVSATAAAAEEAAAAPPPETVTVTETEVKVEEVPAPAPAPPPPAPEPEPEEVEIWGIPLLADERSDVILLKFLRARDFKVKDAFTMIKNTVRWRKEFGIDALVDEDLGNDWDKVVFTHGYDKQGHPVCYNVFGEFENKELYHKTFSDEEKRHKFIRWRIQFLEKSVRKLDFTPTAISTIVQVNDLKNSPGLSKRDLRQATNQALQLLQDNYPEFVAKQVFINVPWWYLAFSRMISAFLTQRTKSKFVFAGPSKSAETLFKYIAPELVPVQYGGLSREGDLEFTTDDPVTEVTIKPATKHAVEFPVSETSHLVWELRVVGWDVNYGAEFVPGAEEGYTVIVQKSRKITSADETVISNSFKTGEPGKVVLTIDNQTSKKKKLLYRSKTKPISE